MSKLEEILKKLCFIVCFEFCHLYSWKLTCPVACACSTASCNFVNNKIFVMIENIESRKLEPSSKKLGHYEDGILELNR